MKYKNFIAIFFACILQFTIISCASKVIKSVNATDNLTIKMTIARNMIAQTRFSLAKEIFAIIQSENPSNLSLEMEINYELGFIALEQRKYQIASTYFNKIIKTYDNAKETSKLSLWPYYLSKKMLEDRVDPVLEKRNRK